MWGWMRGGAMGKHSRAGTRGQLGAVQGEEQAGVKADA